MKTLELDEGESLVFVLSFDVKKNFLYIIIVVCI
jgi:hypothetical protein